MSKMVRIERTPYYKTYDHFAGLDGLTDEEQHERDMRIEREIDEALERERDMRREEEER